MANELVEWLRKEGRESLDACGQEKHYCAQMNAAAQRIEWLESLFDFSDPEVVLHSGPNDPVTKDAVVVLRSHYETKK